MCSRMTNSAGCTTWAVPTPCAAVAPGQGSGAAVSFAAPSQAGYYSYGYQPHCFVKKIKSYDYYGNVIIKHIKVCK